MSTWWDRLGESGLGRVIQGLLLISLAGVVMGILSSIPVGKLEIPAGNGTVDITIVWTLIKVFAPVLMVVSGLRRMGVRI